MLSASADRRACLPAGRELTRKQCGMSPQKWNNNNSMVICITILFLLRSRNKKIRHEADKFLPQRIFCVVYLFAFKRTDDFAYGKRIE
jgi:hypothetical protein